MRLPIGGEGCRLRRCMRLCGGGTGLGRRVVEAGILGRSRRVEMRGFCGRVIGRPREAGGGARFVVCDDVRYGVAWRGVAWRDEGV
jgi:hypothetical protein